jgi:ubiquinone/menaquinone biosynthesis C-methylase UbiE
VRSVDQPADEPGPSVWDRFQRLYWASLSNRYDSFYTSEWSRRENAVVQQSLSDLLDATPSGRLLDLGCGSGHVYILLQQTHHLVDYVGVDISPEMMRESSVPKGHLVCGAMDKLGFVADDAVTCVVAAFSTASYAESIPGLLAEVSRVLCPGGTAQLSFLAPLAISRLRRKSWSTQVYRTRGDRRGWAAAPAHRIGKRRLRRAATSAGLRVTAVTAMNAFSGLVEWPPLWGVGRVVARMAPSLSHTFELTISKPRT